MNRLRLKLCGTTLVLGAALAFGSAPAMAATGSGQPSGSLLRGGSATAPATAVPTATHQGAMPQGAAGGPGGAYAALSPTRLLDTRSNGETLGAGATLSLTVTGGSVPADATAVALNVTATDTTASSYLSVYPAGETRPLLSNLNWTAGQTVPNLVIVPLGSNGQVTFYNNSGSTDIVVDLEGYFAPAGSTAGSYVPMTPARITDTRGGSGQPNSGATLGQGTTLDVQVTGAGGVPSSGVAAVLLNVTVTDTTSPGYLTVYPQGTAYPASSNLNWGRGETVPNRVVVPVGASGQIAVFNSAGSTDVVIDVDGYFTNGSSTPLNASLFSAITPVRVLDTRGTGQTLGTGVSLTQEMAGVDGIASNASAVVTNVTATDTTANSFFTVYPGGTMPVASDVNWGPGETVPNLTVATLSNTGAVNVYNLSGSVDLVIDAFGYFVPETPAPLVITTASLPGMKAGATYSATLTAYGGTPPYSWTVVSGSLPPGLSLSAAGVISGTSSAADTYTFTVQASDSTTPGPKTASAALSIVVSSTAPFDTGNPASNDTTLADAVITGCNWSDSTSTGCDQASVSALDTAMAGEGLSPTIISAGFWSLPYDQQLLLLANGDRTARGLPAISGPAAALDALALTGAQGLTDPWGPSGYSWASNWAEGTNAVEDEFLWMYDDGWGGSTADTFNLDCTSPTASGCWGHRENILMQWGGSASFGGTCVPITPTYPPPPFLPWISCAELFVQGYS